MHHVYLFIRCNHTNINEIIPLMYNAPYTKHKSTCTYTCIYYYTLLFISFLYMIHYIIHYSKIPIFFDDPTIQNS